MRKSVLLIALLLLAGALLGLATERIEPGMMASRSPLREAGETQQLAPGLHLHLPRRQRFERRALNGALRFGAKDASAALKIFAADGSPVKLRLTVLYTLDPTLGAPTGAAIVETLEPLLISAFQKQAPEQLMYVAKQLPTDLGEVLVGLKVREVLITGFELGKGAVTRRQAGYAALAGPQTQRMAQEAAQAELAAVSARVAGEESLAALVARHAQTLEQLRGRQAQALERRKAEIEAETRTIRAEADLEARRITAHGRAAVWRARAAADTTMGEALRGAGGRYVVAIEAARRFADRAERDGLPLGGAPPLDSLIQHGSASAWRRFFLAP